MQFSFPTEPTSVRRPPRSPKPCPSWTTPRPFWSTRPRPQSLFTVSDRDRSDKITIAHPTQEYICKKLHSFDSWIVSTKPSTSCLNTYYKSLYVPIGVLLFYYNSVSQLCSIPKQNKKVLSAKNEGNSKLGNKTQKDKKYVSLISLFDRGKTLGTLKIYLFM